MRKDGTTKKHSFDTRPDVEKLIKRWMGKNPGTRKAWMINNAIRNHLRHLAGKRIELEEVEA